ncbi:MAG: putative metal-binding motif-containing protein [Alphaproteobacteria bacterium]|nr:putative metal-binding motif-containing protein [Alphaproteobacteria bacterium]
MSPSPVLLAALALAGPADAAELVPLAIELPGEARALAVVEVEGVGDVLLRATSDGLAASVPLGTVEPALWDGVDRDLQGGPGGLMRCGDGGAGWWVVTVSDGRLALEAGPTWDDAPCDRVTLAPTDDGYTMVVVLRQDGTPVAHRLRDDGTLDTGPDWPGDAVQRLAGGEGAAMAWAPDAAEGWLWEGRGWVATDDPAGADEAARRDGLWWLAFADSHTLRTPSGLHVDVSVQPQLLRGADLDADDVVDLVVGGPHGDGGRLQVLTATTASSVDLDRPPVDVAALQLDTDSCDELVVVDDLGSLWALDLDPCPIGPDLDGDGYSWDQGDCDDSDPDRHPNAEERCDLVDDDCNGIAEQPIVLRVAPGAHPTETDGSFTLEGQSWPCTPASIALELAEPVDFLDCPDVNGPLTCRVQDDGSFIVRIEARDARGRVLGSDEWVGQVDEVPPELIRTWIDEDGEERSYPGMVAGRRYRHRVEARPQGPEDIVTLTWSTDSYWVQLDDDSRATGNPAVLEFSVEPPCTTEWTDAWIELVATEHGGGETIWADSVRANGAADCPSAPEAEAEAEGCVYRGGACATGPLRGGALLVGLGAPLVGLRRRRWR